MVGLVFALLAPAFASAQPERQGEEPRTEWVNFDEATIVGRRNQPSGAFFNTRQRAKFERLLALKYDVLKDLRSTSRDAALR
jgi:hypothetical protein